MASQASDLKVRVGFLFDNKSLAGIERDMRRTGQRLSQLGSDMTLAISAPLAAVGVSAIKAAGDLESLTLALKSQLGSAEAASRELELLNEAAKNPGLGLEQAVRGSVRLQGVGLAADEARETLIQMGNAIAATGGSAQELDNVTRQFAQMISKGRVLQEDVSILSENMPGLAQLMQKAFGTQSVEAIRAMGVGGKEFVQRITEAAKELPRVEGGIKNNIGNAIDSLKISAGKLGLALNNAFDISGNIDRLASFIASAADAFSNLSSGTQDLIIGLAGVAVAAGPVLKVYGTLKTTGAEIVKLWKDDLVPAAKALYAWIGNVTTAIRAMNLATQAFLLIGIVTAVVALAYEMGAFEKELTAVEKAQQSVNNIQNKAAESIVEQKSKVDTLVKAYMSEGATLEQKQQILKQLNQISPEYFGGIKAGTGDIEAITKATAAYTNELLRQAKVTAAKDRIVEIEKALLNLKNTADPTLFQTIGNGLLSLGNAGQFAANQAKTLGNNIQKQTAALTAERDELAKVVVENTLLEASSKKATAAAAAAAAQAEREAAARERAAKMGEKYRDVIDDITKTVDKAKVFGEDADLAKIDALRNGIEQLIDIGFKPASEEVRKLKEEYDNLVKAFYKPIPIDDIPALPIPGFVSSNAPAPGLPAAPLPQTSQAEEVAVVYENLSESFLKWAESVNLGASALKGLNEGMAVIAESAGPAFEELASSIVGASGAYTRLGASALSAASQIVKAALASTLATAIKDSFTKSGNPLIGIALAGIAVGAVNALFGKIQQSVSKTPRFARGTSYAPGGVALVGEQGPELINLPRGSQVFPTPQTNQMLNGIGQGGVNVSGEFRVQGTDLVLVLERAQQKTNRFR